MLAIAENSKNIYFAHMKRQFLILSIASLVSLSLVTCSAIYDTWRISPAGWLRTGQKSIVLDIQQDGVQAGFMEETAGVTRRYLSLLTNAGYDVYLSRRFVENEVHNWQTFPISGSQRIDHELLGCFKNALTTGNLDWSYISKITSSYDDRNSPELACKASRWPIMEQNRMPGAQFMFNKTRVFVQTTQQQNLPTLELKLKWKSSGGYYLKQVLPGGFEVMPSPGLNHEYTLLHLSASLRLLESNHKILFSRNYPAIFKASYEGDGTRQYVETLNRTCLDIDRGLQ